MTVAHASHHVLYSGPALVVLIALLADLGRHAIVRRRVMTRESEALLRGTRSASEPSNTT